MVQFANAVVGEPIANWDVQVNPTLSLNLNIYILYLFEKSTQGDVLGFSRGGKGFVVIGEANGNVSCFRMS